MPLFLERHDLDARSTVDLAELLVAEDEALKIGRAHV